MSNANNKKHWNEREHWYEMNLTHFFPMFPFDLRENNAFGGIQMEHCEK